MRAFVLITDMGGDDPYKCVTGVTSSEEKAKAWVKSNELYSQYYEEFVVEE